MIARHQPGLPRPTEFAMAPSLSIAEQLAHSTVRLECSNNAGDISTGTGFFYAFARNGNVSVPAIVTNKHVIEGSTRGKFVLTVRGSDGGPVVGKTVVVQLDNFEKRWLPHPDSTVDLCAMPIAPLLREAQVKGFEVFHVQLDSSIVPTDAELQALDLVEDVTMVGYPNGLWDTTNNLPIFRRGATATHPGIDWNGKQEFLIDAACFPGSSGSPVFLFNKSGFADKSGAFNVGQARLKLLGILYAGPQHVAGGQIAVVPVPTSAKPVVLTAIPLNLGIIIKAKALAAFETQFATVAAGTGTP